MKIAVKVGQTWVDRDKRMNGRTVRVERIEHRSKLVTSSPGISGTEQVAFAVCKIGATGRYTRLAVERMERQQGWLLVRDEALPQKRD
jgi:hypothetical protein